VARELYDVETLVESALKEHGRKQRAIANLASLATCSTEKQHSLGSKSRSSPAIIVKSKDPKLNGSTLQQQERQLIDTVKESKMTTLQGNLYIRLW